MWPHVQRCCSLCQNVLSWYEYTGKQNTGISVLFVVHCVRIVANGSVLEELEKGVQAKQWLVPGGMKKKKGNTSRSKTMKQ